MILEKVATRLRTSQGVSKAENKLGFSSLPSSKSSEEGGVCFAATVGQIGDNKMELFVPGRCVWIHLGARFNWRGGFAERDQGVEHNFNLASRSDKPLAEMLVNSE